MTTNHDPVFDSTLESSVIGTGQGGLQNDQNLPTRQQINNSSRSDDEQIVSTEEVVDDAFNKQRYRFDTMRPIQVWGYAVGHFYNDACASIWFNYLLFYLQTILDLKNVAPWSMLAGQIADGIATPLVGFGSDKTETRIGKRIPWYIFGIIVVTGSFLPIFLPLLPDASAQGWQSYLYYIAFPALFNVGWAAVQISHMSLVPSLTCSRKRRDLLNGRRNTFSFSANLFVLLMALIFFQTLNNDLSYPLLAGVTVVVGITLSLFFLAQVREVQLVRDCQTITRNLKQLVIKRLQLQIANYGQTPNRESMMKEYRNTLTYNPPQKSSKTANDLVVEQSKGDDDAEFSEAEDRDGDDVRSSRQEMLATVKKDKMRKASAEEAVSWKYWFGQKLFYQCGVIYMGVRLYCNVIATMLQFYIVYDLQFATEEQLAEKTPPEVALIPLLLYLTSTGVSSIIERLFLKIGRKKTFAIGGVLMIGAAIGLAIIDKGNRGVVYALAIMIGGAQALVLNTGITLISEVIGVRGSSGAFVFGFYSFLDKITTGVALFVMTNVAVFKDESEDGQGAKAKFIRLMIVIVPTAACLLAWVFIILQRTKDYDDDSKKDEKELEANGAQPLIDRKNKKHRNSLEDELAV